MNPALVIEQYLVALAEADLGHMANLFSSESIVHSPLYGSLPALAFYRQLFGRTSQSRLRLEGVFQGLTHPDQWIGYFNYEWTLTGGTSGKFDVCDVFRFDPANGRIAELTIIYDTARAPEQARPRTES